MIKNKELLDLCIKLTAQINLIEKKPLRNLELLAKGYRQRGDIHINLYLNSYVLEGKADCKDKQRKMDKYSLEDYKRSINLFNYIEAYKDKGYAIMALGNAIKERYVPNESKIPFNDLEKEAGKQYQKCVDVFLDIDDIRGYHFVMLEQMNLLIRKEVWKENKRPRRITVFHSLKSPRSHGLLQGIRYIAFKNYCEIWEYHYGRIPFSNIQEEMNFIQDRLEDTCGVIFLASPEYDPKRSIINFEVNKVIELKEKNRDQLGVFIVDLGNKSVVESLKKFRKPVLPEDLDKELSDFLTDEITDIYKYRKFRCQDKKIR